MTIRQRVSIHMKCVPSACYTLTCVCLTVVGGNSADVCKGQEHIQNSHTLGQLVETTNHLSYLIQQLSNDTDVWG